MNSNNILYILRNFYEEIVAAFESFIVHPTSLDWLGKAFSVVQTSHLSTLFRAGVTGVSVKHGHVSMCWKKLLMILA